MLNGLDLFSGIGGMSVALSEWVKPITYCEADRYCQAQLLSRMSRGDITMAPIWDDVRTLSVKGFIRLVDIIYGGFPCQDISVAGTGAGLAGERSGLFFEILRLSQEIKPTFIFLENVPAIRTRGLDTVVREFSNIGYDCRWCAVSAAEVGAPHKRNRWFLLAYSRSSELREQSGWSSRTNRRSEVLTSNDGEEESLADALGVGSKPRWPRLESQRTSTNSDKQSDRGNWWTTEPGVGRVANGVPSRVDRLRGLGNAVVPLQAKTAFERLMGLKRG